MDVSIVYSRALSGIISPLVSVEVHLSRGLPGLSIVGMPETAVRESKDRVRSAILNSRFEYPLRRITVNLAPADLPKDSGRFDLAIAVGILAASGQIRTNHLAQYELIGELALTGELRPVSGVLPIALSAKQDNRGLILPSGNAGEASLIKELEIRPADHLGSVVAHMNDYRLLPLFHREEIILNKPQVTLDMSEVRAQYHAKRALEVAAAGTHNLLMIGPPGSGKTMLSERLPGILPGMSEQEAMESAIVRSISKPGFSPADWGIRPFRAPHHTASAIALVGGGSNPLPGEISLAHRGVLFLDELPEFDRRVLEVLREPMESGKIMISRAARQVEFPADFQLLAAMNPCPCGYFGDGSDRCRCSHERILRYRSKISGPLLDRIDMHIEVPDMTVEVLHRSSATGGDPSELVRKRVTEAHQVQIQRCNRTNSRLSVKQVEKYCRMNREQRALIENAVNRLGLSARAVFRVLKVARTIADLSASTGIQTCHLSEALSFRQLERSERFLS